MCACVGGQARARSAPATLAGMTLTDRPAADVDDMLDALAVLQAWAADPARPRRVLAHGLELVARGSGAAGAHLEACARADGGRRRRLGHPRQAARPERASRGRRNLAVRDDRCGAVRGGRAPGRHALARRPDDSHGAAGARRGAGARRCPGLRRGGPARAGVWTRSTRRSGRWPASCPSTASSSSSSTASASSPGRATRRSGSIDAGGRDRAVHHERDQPRGARPDRRPPQGPRHPRRSSSARTGRSGSRTSMADPRAIGFPAQPPGDAPVPRRAGDGPGPHHRQPLPDREGRAASPTRTSGSSRRSRATPPSRWRTPASTSRSSAWRSSRSASGSARTSTTASSRRSTPSVSPSRTSPR